MRKIGIVFCYLVTLLPCNSVLAQGTVDDYNRAYSLQKKFSSQNVYHWAQNIRWVDSTHVFHYSVQTPEGQQFIIYDADTQDKTIYDSEKDMNEMLETLRPNIQNRPRRFGPPPYGEGARGGATPFRQPQRHWMEVDE
ncbi:MAG: hypothetical protein IKX59_08340, partial [Bacteroidales bacterium]|nr:hypothetical protein [Bacteroidales bacterium]